MKLGGSPAVRHKLQYLNSECVTFGAVREDQRWDIPLPV